MTDDRKLVMMADLRNDAGLITPELALRDALQEFEPDGKWHGWPKVLVIALDDRNQRYGVGFTQARMKCSEMLALLRVLDVKVLAQMGFVRDE